MSGVPLYEALGFVEVERVLLTLANDVEVPFVRMARAIVMKDAGMKDEGTRMKDEGRKMKDER